MRIELVAIGTELLLGFTVDTNAATIGRALADAGIRVVRRTTVGDTPEDIRAAVADALARTGAVITTGGLGPTRDDLSKQVIADLFGWPLRFEPPVWEDIVARFRRLGREPSPMNRSQAEVPAGAVTLRNRWGTAPGLWLDGSPGLVIMLPGVPREMGALLEAEVLPRLRARGAGGIIRSRTVRTTGIPESGLAARVGEMERTLAPLTLGYLPGTEGVDLRLTAWSLPPDEADRLLAAGAKTLRELAGDHAYGEDDDDMAALVLAALRHRDWHLAVAESCTGGMLGGRITAVAGSSDVFRGGFICYDNGLKTDLTGVTPELLSAQGAVSEEVARTMAAGTARRAGTDTAIAVTGIAGPGGGTEGKPVGTVCFGWVAGNLEETSRVVFPGNRQEIRERAVQYALWRLWRLLQTISGS